ncbi:MAG: IS630 family transposase [Gammaproteobacteria bacterium]|nr:IS630 family transposase [Gammaproteobacteria bacterium]
MPRKAASLLLSPEQEEALNQLLSNKSNSARLVERAKLVLLCAQGVQVQQIAAKLDITPNRVIHWRERYREQGLSGLYDRHRSGKPVTYDESFRHQVLQTLEETPPNGMSTWDGPALAAHLNVSTHAVWRLLRKEGISLSRQRSWCVSTDPEFVPKAANIIGLYLNPPANAVVLSVDEKPSMQALERSTGYVKTSSGKIVRGLKSTYKRHGTLNLFAALEVATGHINGKTTAYKKRPDFIEFMEDVVSGYPKDREIHVILDNYCIHKRNEGWLKAHPNVFFHFTPTSASRLNQVEIWFGIMSRKVLRGANFVSVDALKTAIEKYIAAYNPSAKPFVWKKREVVGSQIKDIVINLCN